MWVFARAYSFLLIALLVARTKAPIEKRLMKAILNLPIKPETLSHPLSLFLATVHISSLVEEKKKSAGLRGSRIYLETRAAPFV